MFCPNCGNELSDDAVFCGSCGNKIGQSEPAGSPASSSAPVSGPQSGSSSSSTKSASSTAASAASTIKATAGIVGTSAKANPKLFVGIGVAAVCVIAAIALAVMFFTGGFTGGQTAGSFKKAFEEQRAYLQGAPSTAYVMDGDYKLTSCNVSDIQKKNDDWVTAKIDAVIENGAYKVNMAFAADYYNYPNASRASKSSFGNYRFAETSSQIEALSGISKDDNHGLSNVESELSEDKTSCSVTVDDSYDFWFAESSVNTTYRYKMTEHGWEFDSEEPLHKVTYKDIDGNYAAKTGDMAKLTGFAISGLNAETGSFSLQVSTPEIVNDYNTRQAATATLTATIDPKRKEKNSMKDGYSYYFEANGSSTGGTGSAQIKGYFTIGEDGSRTINVVDGDIGVTVVYSIGSPSNSSESLDGVVYKQ